MKHIKQKITNRFRSSHSFLRFTISDFESKRKGTPRDFPLLVETDTKDKQLETINEFSYKATRGGGSKEARRLKLKQQCSLKLFTDRESRF